MDKVDASYRMATDTFGFDLLEKVYHDEICKKEDVIILFFHWYLVKNGCRCIGIGDSKVFDASEKGSELLPSEWNTGPNYALRYLKSKELYALLGVKSNMDLLLNLVNFKDNSISNIMFPIEETVSALHGPLMTTIPSYETILQNVQNDFSIVLFRKNTKEAETQTTNERDVTGAATLPNLRRSPERDPERADELDPERDPGRIGARDLDPLAQGGGMIFNPFAERRPLGRLPGALGVPGRLPPGAVPPGARFYPFGPPDVDPMRPFPRRPGNDHLPPPGFDDMFM
ncbi:hypothetical protein DMN91_011610 [Ooceraea biroi]|uniref:Proteasome inhibitor PI31 subunit n=1 Tax=Ooceraea biroi TaxID=2015173 RepID=A0A026VWC7_OOCBI|nr:proteasome inhibitor PI31 subunit [Ooceraea biroi]EZA47826.1 Proteasome inhibitor PI31 subunit [Ooceraea biroi]RLU15854.1 hypothetical protein DMN91_011610 [Ooceraea biroi]